MLIRVSSASFRKAIDSLVSGGSTNINFSIRGDGKLYLQSCTTVPVNKRIPILEIEDWNVGDNFTATCDQLLMLLSNEMLAKVELKVVGDMLEITQGSFRYSAERKHTETLDDGSFGKVSQATKLNGAQLASFINATRALDEVARVLGFPSTKINICDGMGYVDYSIAFLTAPVDLPDMAISSVAAKLLIKYLPSGSTYKCIHDAKRNLLRIIISEDEEIVVPTLTVDKFKVEIVQTLRSGLTHVSTVNISKQKELLNLICKVYKQVSIEFGVCEDGVKLFVNNSGISLNVGSQKLPIVTMRMSTTQLVAIAKLFGDAGEVVIKKGDDKLCLEHRSSNKSLILGGLTY